MKTTRTPAFVKTSAGRQTILAAALAGALSATILLAICFLALR